MEEKNKEVKMGVVKGSKEEPKKPTFEQLNQAFMEVSQQNGMLRQRLQQAEKYIGTINRLDYLIKVVELANSGTTYSFSNDFIVKCISEIEQMMTIPEETDKKDPEEN
jgi:ferritin